LDARVRVALDIGIIEAQHHGPVIVSGKKPIENERPRTSDVQKPGR